MCVLTFHGDLARQTGVFVFLSIFLFSRISVPLLIAKEVKVGEQRSQKKRSALPVPLSQDKDSAGGNHGTADGDPHDFAAGGSAEAREREAEMRR